MRVAELDMRNSSSKCPSGLREVVHSGHRLCEKDIDDENRGGCSQVFFKTNVSYDQVCGKIISYQFGTPDSFGLHPPSKKKLLKRVTLMGLVLHTVRQPPLGWSWVWT